MSWKRTLPNSRNSLPWQTRCHSPQTRFEVFRVTRRIESVNVLLRQEISRVLANELKDPRLASLVSVTHVDAAPDLRSARVFISVFGDQEDKRSTLKALRSASGFIRNSVRKRVSLRNVPHVEFRIDETIEQGADVLKIIDDVDPGPEVEEST